MQEKKYSIMHAFGTQIQSLFWGYNTQEIYLTKVNSRQAPPPFQKKEETKYQLVTAIFIKLLETLSIVLFQLPYYY